jgi:hypothetical protein
LILAILGIWQARRRRIWREAPFILFAAFTLLFLIALLFSAHGVQPDPERYVTPREAHVLVLGAALLATLGLELVPRHRALVAAFCGVVGLWMSDSFLRRATEQPAIALSLAAARYLDAHVRPHERAVVLCAPITEVGAYLDDLEHERGAAGRAAGVAILNTLDTRPPDYQRILVHSRLGKRQLENYSGLIASTRAVPDTVVRRPVPEGSPNWIVAWSNFRPTSAGEERLAALVAALRPVATFRRDSLSLAVYHVR